MNVIILPGLRSQLDQWFRSHPDSLAVPGTKITIEALVSGTWLIMRRDSWQYDERIVAALHQLSERPGVELIDPTGLLGGSRYGFDIGREEKAPIIQRSLRGRVAPQPRSPAEPPPPRKRQPRASS